MPILFYSHHQAYGCFSNFSNHPVSLKNKIWKTSEHYFQAQKFVGTAHEEAVRKTKTPGDAAHMGRDRSLPLRKDWEPVRDNVMRQAVLAKFLQNEDAKQELLSTGKEKLIEHTSKDSYWADGGDGSGENMLGIILMEVRSAIENNIVDEYRKQFGLGE